jgi:hypothetical protein
MKYSARFTRIWEVVRKGILVHFMTILIQVVMSIEKKVCIVAGLVESQEVYTMWLKNIIMRNHTSTLQMGTGMWISI